MQAEAPEPYNPNGWPLTGLIPDSPLNKGYSLNIFALALLEDASIVGGYCSELLDSRSDLIKHVLCPDELLRLGSF